MDIQKCIDTACDFYVQDTKSCNVEGDKPCEAVDSKPMETPSGRRVKKADE